MPRFAWLGWLALPFVVALPTAVAEPPTLAGQWSATALTPNWVIGDWGSACGPKPSGGGAPAGTVTIKQNGAELIFSGAGRTYSTTECWEQYPGLSRVSHTASARAYKNVCKTPATDPRQATIVTTITATDHQITFDETGQYQFVVAGQNCTASVRRTRFLKLIRREGDPEPAPAPAQSAAAPAVSTTPKPAPAPAKESPPRACQAPGAPARLEVRPAHKLLRPGETFTFRASVLDKAGCALNVNPTFRLVSPPPGVELVSPGTLRVADTAPEGEVKLLASVGDRSVTMVAEVVSAARYDALLGEGRFDALGESGDAAVTRIESSSIGSRGTTLHDEGALRKKLFIGVVGTLALAFGVFGFVAIRRSRRLQRQSLVPTERLMRAETGPDAPRPQPVAVEPVKGMVCPTCREEYPPEAKFCANDGNRLVPLKSGFGVAPAGGVCPVCGQGYDPGISTCPKHDEPLIPAVIRGSAQNENWVKGTRKICPVCGAQFSGDSQFCGNCGASLVPVN
jgi:hypothetical protein